MSIEQAYALCERDARAHYENFPVASVLVPRAMRHHIAAVYVFARTADDFADEGQRSPEDRLRLLEGWSERLHRTISTSMPGPPPAPGEPPHTREIFTALGATIRAKALPVDLFDDLLSAFRQDVTVRRYQSWPDLHEYCRRSANPVGRLVLRIAGQDEPRLDEWSDAICTALQLTNFWQDLLIDWARGRLYVPLSDVTSHGAEESDLSRGRITSAWRDVLTDVTLRTRELFRRGRPLCDAVRGRLRYELRATWLGGMRILDRLERGGFDIHENRPRLTAADLPWVAWRMTTWQAVVEADLRVGHKTHEP